MAFKGEVIDWKNSVLLFDKRKGVTSYKAIEEAGRLLGTRKIGHSGTLDRAASGLLVICTGSATRLTQYFLGSDKRYTATIRLGTVTDTDDGEGAVIETRDAAHIDERMIGEALKVFLGSIKQRAPLYSALKIRGKRASDRARMGQEVPLKERDIRIDSIDILSMDGERKSVVLDVRCSKGTYIRSLARDLGEKLGTGAFLEDLRRTESGRFRVEDAASIEDLQEIVGSGTEAPACRIGPFDALESFGFIAVSADARRKVLNGAAFDRSEAVEIRGGAGTIYCIGDDGKNLFAIADMDIDNWTIRYLNVFNEPLH